MTIITIIINALFTGIGTATGLAIFEYWVKPYIAKLHRSHKKILKRLKA